MLSAYIYTWFATMCATDSNTLIATHRLERVETERSSIECV